MHDHQPKVVSERVSDEEPVATEILEPDLGFVGSTSVDDSQPAVLHFRVDLIGVYVLSIEKWLEFKKSNLLFLRIFIITAFIIVSANSGKLECLVFDLLYLLKLVEVH